MVADNSLVARIAVVADNSLVARVVAVADNSLVARVVAVADNSLVARVVAVADDSLADVGNYFHLDKQVVDFAPHNRFEASPLGVGKFRFPYSRVPYLLVSLDKILIFSLYTIKLYPL